MFVIGWSVWDYIFAIDGSFVDNKFVSWNLFFRRSDFRLRLLTFVIDSRFTEDELPWRLLTWFVLSMQVYRGAVLIVAFGIGRQFHWGLSFLLHWLSYRWTCNLCWYYDRILRPLTFSIKSLSWKVSNAFQIKLRVVFGIWVGLLWWCSLIFHVCDVTINDERAELLLG